MFKTFIGPVEEDAAQIWLRPETAQGMFVNFANVVNSTRRRLPFGIAQQGKGFRNEISPGNFVFRLREFELMEMEYFCKPGTDASCTSTGARSGSTGTSRPWACARRISASAPHAKEELSHYSTATSDIEYRYPFGWGELEGVADRTDFDLKTHMEHSGRDLSYFDPETNERYVPYVIEPAVSTDRIFITLLVDAYDEEEVRGEKRVVLHLHPDVAPVQVAVLPLSKKAELTEPARRIEHDLRPHFATMYDETQAIGRRYRRQDEIGTPLAITFDFNSLNDNAVTIRERDGMTQVRVPIEGLHAALQRSARSGPHTSARARQRRARRVARRGECSQRHRCGGRRCARPARPR